MKHDLPLRSVLFAVLLAGGCESTPAQNLESAHAPVGAWEAARVVAEPPPDPVEAPVEEAPAEPEVRAGRPCPAEVEGMSCVPGTEFTRGLDDDAHACVQDDQPADRRSAAVPSARIYVDTFLMDKTEVTVEAYTACVNAGKCPNSGPVYADYRAPKQPITGNPWYDAVTFCEFVGKRLPTEAEWELAARGPDSEIYPWGSAPAADCELAVVMDDRGRSCGEIKRRGKNPEKGRVLEVGSRPAGRYGLFDMVGNAEEWVADWWTPTWAECGADCLGDNPKGPCGGAEPCGDLKYRAVRGGSWYWPAEHANGYHRRRNHPINKPFHHFGFRCAKSLDPIAE
jgi:sulfatase modifying factor 1